MLSSFSRIQLSSGPITLNPLILAHLKVAELSDEDFLKYFYSLDCDGGEDDYNNLAENLIRNDYYCKAVLKLPSSVTATFESNPNYVFFIKKKCYFISLIFSYILNLMIILRFG